MARGGKREGAGRKEGVPNKITTTLKEAILTAAEKCGRDGKGKDGLEGYLVDLAKNNKKTFGMLLGKVLPMQVTGADGGDINITVRKIVHSARNNG